MVGTQIGQGTRNRPLIFFPANCSQPFKNSLNIVFVYEIVQSLVQLEVTGYRFCKVLGKVEK